MRFEEAYEGWQGKRLTQEEAARLLGVCERTLRRYIDRSEEEGLQGLIDQRLSQVSPRRAPVDEVVRLVDQYRRRHEGWSAQHFYAWSRRDGGTRSYTWVKSRLQEAEAIPKAEKRGTHRKRRERRPLPGMWLHQDGSTHEWVPGSRWDLIVTMDDATHEHDSMFFVEEEGTWSSFRGVQEVIAARGWFCVLYTDLGSHYWHTPEAGGKVDQVNLTQFVEAMKRLGIEMIPAYSPEARGRSERAFATHQARLPKELALTGITERADANRYLNEVDRSAFNQEFSHPAREEGSAFVPFLGGSLDDVLCEQYERTMGQDHCIRFEGRVLQIPADRHRYHYVKAQVRVHRYTDGRLALFHGPRRLATYGADGRLAEPDDLKAAT